MARREQEGQDARRRRRVQVPRFLHIVSDRELVKAQHLNDRIDEFIGRLETQEFPVSAIDPNLVAGVVEAMSTMQHAIVAGIEEYYAPRPVLEGEQ